MWDGIELWLRKAGGLLLLGVVMIGYALHRDGWWLPWRVTVLLSGIVALVSSAAETRKLIRSRESAETALDRLEAAERGEGEGH
ncbi:hypothetical protein [Streptomyces cadmiisoli]|uniref:Uncharacterized protein n=1 Tax=Streptomyces cadmiisoli TaxID=2184053 RepID=A0A2Z4JES0_9ACTN|nr:hypothetical protein [Streptomyces cadmiisoli]AWW43318.1 hypothetical protein DN051_42870 [Streptomyces cadmiisoli]